MQHRDTKYIYRAYVVQTTQNKSKIQPTAQCIKKMQLRTSILPSRKHKIQMCQMCRAPSMDRCLVWPHLFTPASELRIAVQAIGDEIHDVFPGS